jgi:carboxylesterase
VIASDPFELQGDHRGVLLVHGFTGSPFEMRVLGERLGARGMTVVCPALAGHTSRSAVDLDRTRWNDWMATVDREFDRLRERCRSVAVVGLSMGGLLALRLARRRGSELRAMSALAAPLWLPAYARYGIPIAARAAAVWNRLALIPKPGGGSDVRDPEMRRLNPTMTAFPVNALVSLLELCRMVRAEVNQIHVPAFLAHGSRDRTVPPACLDELERRIGSTDKRSLRLDGSCHVITIDVERERLARELGDFLAERM